MLNEEMLELLLHSPDIVYKSTRKNASTNQGAYLLWLDSDPKVCIKVGHAGPRSGKGLRERLRRHFRCKSILGDHIMKDETSTWRKGYDFSKREECKRFLAERCYFQTVDLPDLEISELKAFDYYLEAYFHPRYAGHPRK